MPRLRSLPEQAIMRDLYRTHPGTCKPLGELTETAMRGPSPFIAAAVYEVGWGDDALRKAGGNAEVEALDVSNAASVQRVAQAILGRHRRIDVLVNSAGLNNLQRFWRDQTVESWDQVIRINLDGTFYCTHAVLPSRRERKDGW